MSRSGLKLWCGTLLFGIALGGWLDGPRHPDQIKSRSALEQPYVGTDVSITMVAEDTEFGCRVNMEASNGGKNWTIRVSSGSQVRSSIGLFWGTWKKIGVDASIHPGKTAKWAYNHDFGCGVGRQYRFELLQLTGGNAQSYPRQWLYCSDDTQCKHNSTTSVTLGNLNRFF